MARTLTAVEQVAAEGTACRLIYAKQGNVEELLHALPHQNPREAQHLPGLMVAFQRLADEGWITNPTQFKRVTSLKGMFVFKRHQIRVFGFFHTLDNRRMFVLVHAMIKKSTKQNRKELKKSQRVREEWQAGTVKLAA